MPTLLRLTRRGESSVITGTNGQTLPITSSLHTVCISRDYAPTAFPASIPAEQMIDDTPRRYFSSLDTDWDTASMNFLRDRDSFVCAEIKNSEYVALFVIDSRQIEENGRSHYIWSSREQQMGEI